MPRGGRRVGRVGNNYPQRSDLRQPIQTAQNQTYGDVAQQRAAQRAIPLPTQQQAVPSAPGAGAAPGPSPLAPTGPLPGSLTPLHAPTARPDEPLTAGLSIGAGPGPSTSPMVGPDGSLANLLNRMAQSPSADQSVQRLASYVSAGSM